MEAGAHQNGVMTGTEPVVDALRRKIATLQEQQKDAIQRLGIQRISMQDAGLELARLEDELAAAQKLLESRLDNSRLPSTVY
jgi:hypothetical protein